MRTLTESPLRLIFLLALSHRTPTPCRPETLKPDSTEKLMQARMWISAAVVLLLSVTAALAAANDTSGVDVTFYKDVLPLLQENCQECHRASGTNMGGMVAPMAFTSYQETRPWARAMAKAVANRDMPPWDASPIHAGVFEDERVLSEDEIQTIVRWSRTGAVAGDQADAPPVREFPSYQE